MAVEVGIDPALIDRAARLIPRLRAESLFERLIGGPIKHRHEAQLPTRLTEARSTHLLSAVRAHVDKQGEGQADASGMIDGMDKFQQQAFEVITSGVAKAFDLSQEDPRTVARYDTGHLVRPNLWDYKNNREHYHANAQSLGKLLLLARRLCEAG